MQFACNATTESTSVPVIDIGSWVGFSDQTSSLVAKKDASSSLISGLDDVKRQSVSEQWNHAFHRYGCAVIVGHGIPESIFRDVNAEALEFFHQSVEYKMGFNHGKYGHPRGGYTGLGQETVALSTDATADSTVSSSGAVGIPKSDPVENFVFTGQPSAHRSPQGCSSPLPRADAYYDLMTRLLSVIHRISSDALGITDLDFFEQFYDPNVTGNEYMGKNGNALRLAYYPPIHTNLASDRIDLNGGDAVVSSASCDDKIRYGAHTDYQGFTLLRPDESDWHDVVTDGAVTARAGGLEVYDQSLRRWIPVVIPPLLNALVINAGDLIQRWTNDHWHSPLHRVVSGWEGSAAGGLLPRQSIVFFTGPLDECIIRPLDLPSLVTAPVSGEDGWKAEGSTIKVKYDPIRSLDHLLMKLNRTN